jgi:hypothetical protein
LIDALDVVDKELDIDGELVVETVEVADIDMKTDGVTPAERDDDEENELDADTTGEDDSETFAEMLPDPLTEPDDVMLSDDLADTETEALELPDEDTLSEYAAVLVTDTDALSDTDPEIELVVEIEDIEVADSLKVEFIEDVAELSLLDE